MTDDTWDSVQSSIVIYPEFTEGLKGLDLFSHLQVIFQMHQANSGDLSRHPRGNKSWPITGIFAQRAKDRPNKLGTTVCRLIRIRDNIIEVSGLDAIDGSPVLDLKPWVREFGPRGEVHQPVWITELMSGYW
jgi:tRNA (adenine37-N6)-methyltransferase